MIKVSIIVPVYNVEAYLETCLTSLVKQTLQEIELIVVNDGTKDQSQTIIDSFVEKYPTKIHAYQKENGGLSSARNYGMTKATGEYVAFVDSDDWVDITMYEAMYEKAKQHDFDLVVCDFNEIREGVVVPCICHQERDIFGKEEIKEAMIDVYPSAWNKLYKRSVLEDLAIQFKPGVWFEDVEFIYRLLPYLTCIGVVKQAFYQYMIRSNSISSSADQRIFHYIENWNGVIAFYQKQGLYEEYRDVVEYCYVRYLFATFIKSATKLNKKLFKKAVIEAKQQVRLQFPKYRHNPYMKNGKLKNLYLKFFCNMLAYLVYYKMQK